MSETRPAFVDGPSPTKAVAPAAAAEVRTTARAPSAPGHLDRRLRELHEYVRHMWSELLKWFTVFVSINYATMGWLAKDAKDNRVVVVIAILFVTQNALGIAAELVILRYLQRATRQAVELERRIDEEFDPITTPIPIPVYARGIMLMIGALVMILAAWVAIPFVMPKGAGS